MYLGSDVLEITDLQDLIGAADLDYSHEGDCGLRITFENGDVTDIGYSAGEGGVFLNGNEVRV